MTQLISFVIEFKQLKKHNSKFGAAKPILIIYTSNTLFMNNF